MSGMDTTGFEAKTYEEILADIEAEQKARLGENLDVSPDSVLGQINAIFARQQALTWELLGAIYAAQYPDSANGFALTSLAALTGTTRRAATPSTVLATVTIDGGTSFAAGDLVAFVAGSPEELWENTDAVANPGGSPDSYDIEFHSQSTGAIRANAGTLEEMVPVVGWTAITNVLDADLGSAEETDSELRVRREQEIAASGASTVEGIRADVLEVADVETVTVLENDTDATVDGIPAHSIEVLVRGGDDADIAAAIFASKAAGIQAFGVDSEVVEDSEGNEHTIGFTRPTELLMYLDATVETDPDTYIGDTAAKEFLADWANAYYSEGVDVLKYRIIGAIMSIPGVLDLAGDPFFEAGDSSPDTSTDVAVGSREIAVWDTSRLLWSSF